MKGGDFLQLITPLTQEGLDLASLSPEVRVEPVLVAVCFFFYFFRAILSLPQQTWWMGSLPDLYVSPEKQSLLPPVWTFLGRCLVSF